jgi:hypothetical protein
VQRRLGRLLAEEGEVPAAYPIDHGHLHVPVSGRFQARMRF